MSQMPTSVSASSDVFPRSALHPGGISSSNFPRFDRNPNTGPPIATETKLVQTQQQIYHDAQHPSHIRLPVILR